MLSHSHPHPTPPRPTPPPPHPPPQEVAKKEKAKYKFMQKYYHKGAFFQEAPDDKFGTVVRHYSARSPMRALSALFARSGRLASRCRLL